MDEDVPKDNPVQWPRLVDLSGHDNLLLVLSDTHRQDFAAPLTQGWHATPHLELLAQQGVRFTDATTPVPISAPAYASLLTGLSPLDHGVLNNHQDLPTEVPVLAEALRQLGYETAAVIGNPFCSSAHGFARGFDHVWDDIDGHGKDGGRLTDEALRWLEQRDGRRPFFLFIAYMDAHTPYVTPSTPHSLLLEVDDLPWGTFVAEDAHRDQRFEVEAPPGTQRWRFSPLTADGRVTQAEEAQPSLFLTGLAVDDERLSLETRGLQEVDGYPRFRQLVGRFEIDIHNPTPSTLSTHLRFRVHRRYDADETPPLYAAGVRRVDTQVGRLMGYLNASGLEASTTVAFVSDHGEMLGEHQAWGHVEHLWQETLSIPLILRSPRLPAGVDYTAPFDLVELHGLLRVLAGERRPNVAPEFPFAIAEPGESAAADPVRISWTFPPEAPTLQVAVRRGADKVLLGSDDVARLFDLDADPRELRDVLADRRQEQSVRQLISLAKEQLAAAAQAESLDLESLSPAEIDRLRALGYLD